MNECLYFGEYISNQNDIKNAIAHYERAIALDPDFVDAQINLGICLRDSGEVDRAISCHQRALQSNPRSILALANLARYILCVH